MQTTPKNKILYCDHNAVANVLDLGTAVRLVEEAFIADGLAQIQTFPVISHRDKASNGTWIIKSGVIEDENAESSKSILGLKVGAYWPANESGGTGVTNHNATMVMTDLKTGCVASIISANLITSFRTAAGGALGSKYLGMPDPKIIAIIGAGDQAAVQLQAHLLLLPSLNEVRVWSRNLARADEYAAQRGKENLAVCACASAKDAVKDADLIVTTTPSGTPILFAGWIKPGAHISAIGSDARGKQELDAYLVAGCSFFTDKKVQSVTIGEMQQPLAKGLVTESHILAELGQVCAGRHPGRRSQEEITIFDSSGVSFQDLAIAAHVEVEARKRNIGQYLNR